MASKSPKKPTKAGVPKPGKLPKKALTGAAGMPVPQAQANGGGYPQNPRWESVTQSNGRQILYMGANVDARRDLRSRDRQVSLHIHHAVRIRGLAVRLGAQIGRAHV